MSKQIKRISLLAVGIAMFVVLSLCLQVPVFENYYLCLGYVVMAVYCCSFGTLSGTIVGFFGVVLYCVVTRLELAELRSILRTDVHSSFATVTEVGEIVGVHMKRNSMQLGSVQKG